MAQGSNPQRSITLIACLVLSMGLNLLLAATAIRHLRPGPNHETTGDAANEEPVRGTSAEASMNTPQALLLTNGFHWRELESTDYEVYVANLRRAGCPERTICDIIWAELDEVYDARRRQIEIDEPFWVAGRERRRLERQREAQLRVLEQERTVLLAALQLPDRLSHEDFPPEGFHEQAVLRFLIGPMSEEKCQAVLAAATKFDRLRAEVKKRAGGILIDEDEEELRRLNEAVRRELRGLLSAAELEEMMARPAGLQLFADEHVLKFVQLSPTELRQIALLKIDGGRDWVPFEWDGPDRPPNPEQEARFHQAVAALLGSARFEDFQRSQDREFREVVEFTDELHLPRQSAVTVHEIRFLAAEQMSLLRAEATLSEEDRAARVLELEASIQQGVFEVLGGQAYEQFVGGAGSWVTNLSGLKQ